MADITNYDDVKKVLEQRGFSENQDFMFVGMDSETDFMFDGIPMYRIANYLNNTTNFYSEQLKRDLTLEVISDFNMGVENKQTSGNNGVYAVYLKKHGFIFTKKPEIKQVMEKDFGFKDTHFGNPLSNGAKFRDDKKQKIWQQILLRTATKQLNQTITNKKLDTNLMGAIVEQTMDK